MLREQESVLERGASVKSCRGREPRRPAAPHGSVLGFMAMGLVSRLSVASHSDSGSFLMACTSLH